jgi:hypothetical protein
MDINLENINRALQKVLEEIGFLNSEEMLRAAQISPSKCRDNLNIKLTDSTSSLPPIVFKLIAESTPDGNEIRIFRAITTQAFQAKLGSKKTKTVKNEYSSFRGIPTRETMTKDMLNSMDHTKNQQDLSDNLLLRKQLNSLGFDADMLFSKAVGVGKFLEANGLTVLHEELRLRGAVQNYPKHVGFILRVRRLPTQQHQLDSVEAHVTPGRPYADSAMPQIEYQQSEGKFPTKLEIIKALGKETPLAFTARTQARQVDRLIKEAKNKAPKNFISHYALK